MKGDCEKILLDRIVLTALVEEEVRKCLLLRHVDRKGGDKGFSVNCVDLQEWI
jgi:hypothetical protein